MFAAGLLALGAVGADDGGGRRVGHGQALAQAVVARHGLGIAAEQNIRAAARHVRRDRHGALAAGLRDDVRLALMLFGVQHVVRDAGFFEQIRKMLGFFDGDGADQHGLAALVQLADAVGLGVVVEDHAVHHGLVFFLGGAVDHVGKLVAEQRAVGRDGDDVEIVDLAEFGGFGQRRAGHAGKLLIHAEIILEGDRRQRLVFALDLHALPWLRRPDAGRRTSGGRASRGR